MPEAAPSSRSDVVRDYIKANPQAGTQTVVDALHAQGIDVSASLVKKIKYGRPNVANGATKRRRKVTGNHRPGKKSNGTISGSQAIREYLRDHPGAKPKEIKAGLRQQGIKVSTGLIGSVKHHATKAQNNSRVVRSAARYMDGEAVSLRELVEVKKFADGLGGVDRVRQALEALELLR